MKLAFWSLFGLSTQHQSPPFARRALDECLARLALGMQRIEILLQARHTVSTVSAQCGDKSARQRGGFAVDVNRRERARQLNPLYPQAVNKVVDYWVWYSDIDVSHDLARLQTRHNCYDPRVHAPLPP
jgi:hypothetical protein